MYLVASCGRWRTGGLMMGVIATVVVVMFVVLVVRMAAVRMVTVRRRLLVHVSLLLLHMPEAIVALVVVTLRRALAELARFLVDTAACRKRNDRH